MDDLNAAPVRVGIVGRSLPCWGLERLVQSGHPHLELVMTWPSVQDAEANAPPVPCDVIVMDLEGDECLATISRLRSATTACLLLVTGSTDPALLDQAVLRGVRGVVQKAELPATLLKAIGRVKQGECWIDQAATGRIFMELARRSAAAAAAPEPQVSEGHPPQAGPGKAPGPVRLLNAIRPCDQRPPARQTLRMPVRDRIGK